MDEPAANDQPVEGVTDQSQEVGNPVLLSVKLTVLFVATLTEETLLPLFKRKTIMLINQTRNYNIKQEERKKEKEFLED